MIDLKVNWIYHDAHVIRGITGFAPHVLDNIGTMRGDNAKEGAKIMARGGKDFFMISRFCQYVCFLQFKVDQNYGMTFYDFKGNMDFVLDEYNILTEAKWSPEIKDKIASIVTDIIANPSDRLATFDLIPLALSDILPKDVRD